MKGETNAGSSSTPFPEARTAAPASPPSRKKDGRLPLRAGRSPDLNVARPCAAPPVRARPGARARRLRALRDPGYPALPGPHPAGAPATPADPRDAARMDQVMNVCDWYLFQGVNDVIGYHRIVAPALLGLAPDEEAIAGALPRALHVVGELARLLGNQRFFAGDAAEPGRPARRAASRLPGGDAGMGDADGGPSRSSAWLGRDELPPELRGDHLGARRRAGEGRVTCRLRRGASRARAGCAPSAAPSRAWRRSRACRPASCPWRCRAGASPGPAR